MCIYNRSSLNIIGRILIGLVWLMGSTGCQSKPTHTSVSVQLTPDHALKLPQLLFGPTHVSQLLTFKKGSQQRNFQVILKQDANQGLRLAAFDLFGTPLFQLNYKPHCEPGRPKCGSSVLQISQARTQGGFAKQILRDLFLIYGLEKQIRSRLPPGLTLYTSLQERYLSLYGRKILVIKYHDPNPWKGPVSYENFEDSYHLKIKNLPLETL